MIREIPDGRDTRFVGQHATRQRGGRGDGAHLLGLACSRGNPGLRLVPCLVECKEPSLATTLDELIGLSDKFCREYPAGELSIGRDGTSIGIPGDLRDLWLGEDKRGGDLCVCVDRRGPLKPVSQQELRVVLADGCALHQQAV